MNTEFVRALPVTGTGATQKLWKVTPPIKYRAWRDGEDEKVPIETEYVITSAVNAYSGPETYIFPANEEGLVMDWMELPGSFQGALDHEAAIAGLAEEEEWKTQDTS